MGSVKSRESFTDTLKVYLSAYPMLIEIVARAAYSKDKRVARAAYKVDFMTSDRSKF